MENVACNVIYVDRSISRDRSVGAPEHESDWDLSQWESARIAENVRVLLNSFDQVHLCSTGGACLTQWLDLQETSVAALKPTVFILDTPYQEHIPRPSRSRSPSPLSLADHGEGSQDQEEELYGLALLQRIISESYVRNTSKLVVTVPIVGNPYGSRTGDGGGCAGDGAGVSPEDRRKADLRMVKKCLDLGATDVMTNPMNGKCIANLEVHAYRAHRDASRDQKAILELRKGRKRSWVGISEEKPFAYLREAMVSKLMNWICRIGSETEDGLGSIKLTVSLEKQAEISSAVGRWHFSAHDFTDDELVVAALVMFKHALSMPELDPWRIPTDQLYRFLIACRAAYNEFVPYHNFRHVVDVLQATFHFLVCIGSLPPYSSPNGLLSEAHPKSPIAKLLQPFDALALLITAIGHDVGHPGVNNGFLVTLNAPLAQLYNDRSVLESFHCAAYSQILRRYWASVFHDNKMRKLMISSILATDMGLHFDYMKKLADLQEKLRVDNGTDDWTESVKNEQRALTCALLIKCADISNVARRHDTALQWTHILSDEFARQATMETELEIPTSLMSEPKKDIVSLATAQLQFMNLFAIPLFRGAADILPAMQYCVDELEVNKGVFDRYLLEGQEQQSRDQQDNKSDLPLRTIAFATPLEPATEAHPQPPKGCPGVLPTVVEPRLGPGQHTDSFQKPHQGPRRPTDGRVVNGIVTAFGPGTDSSYAEPFNADGWHPPGHTRQRCSETTEGSSARYTGDWASQATSATTGKMPLSPSTQGTSIVSKDSFERLNSVPATTTTLTAPDSVTTSSESGTGQPDFKLDSLGPPLDDDEPLQNGQVHYAHDGGAARMQTQQQNLDPESAAGAPRQLKKKPSRFRINGLQSLFRKHKSSSPTMQATDPAG